MLDIIFISYDEPNAEENWVHLKGRFPHARRVHGVRGIAEAHFAAAEKANTKFFYVVDGDARICDTFDFSYKPTEHEADYVHIWHARNPATGLTYGYGGVKLFAKKFFSSIKPNYVDFSTSLTKDVKIMEEVACITYFNSDEFRTYRGGYREAAKLYLASVNQNIPEAQRTEAQSRLNAWLNPSNDCAFRQHLVNGVLAGFTDAHSHTDGTFVNDFDRIRSLFELSMRNVDAQPANVSDYPGLPFICRLSSILYDDEVLKNLSITELRDAISDGQLYSKVWLADRLYQLNLLSDSKIVVLGGWIGTLSFLLGMFSKSIRAIVSVDLDARANTIAEKLNYDKPFSTLKMDMYKVDTSLFDVIINTSSEHIPDIAAWRRTLPPGKVVVVQNTNYKNAEGHISTVDCVSDLANKLELSEIIYEGSRAFPQYSRFMIIGRT